MFAACSKISYLPVASPSNVLSSLQRWIFGKVEDTYQKIEILSSSPIITTKATSSENQGIITVSVIHSPKDLTNEEKDQIFKLTLPYTSRAFKQEFATMDSKTMQEHFDHTTPGDFLFLAVLTSTTKSENDDAAKKEENNINNSLRIAPKVVFHLLCSMYDIQTPSSTSTRRAMCCSAYCCDPSFQNCGLATIVHTAALQFLQPKLIIMRTVNPSMLKLLKRTSPIGSKLFPNDCKTEEDWIEARNIAKDAVKKWDHLSCQIEKYDEEKLVFNGAYSTELDEVFNKNNNSNNGKSGDEKKPDQVVVQSSSFNDIHVNPGDAQLRIMVLS